MMATGPASDPPQASFPGYGQFCVDLEENLNKKVVLKLATIFEFTPAEKGALRKDDEPASEFVDLLNEKGKIKEDNITELTDALDRNGYHGILDKVRRSFEKNVKLSQDGSTDSPPIKEGGNTPTERSSDTAPRETGDGRSTDSSPVERGGTTPTECSSDRAPGETDGQICHAQYPYVSAAKFEKNKHNPIRLNILNEDSAEEYEQLFRNYSMESNSPTPPQTKRPEPVKHLRVVMIGKTGSGKSATANSLLGENRFIEGNSSLSETSSSGIATSDISDNRHISVVDCPGLKDTAKSDKNILLEMGRMAYLLREGVHAFVLVWDTTRFSDDAEDVLTTMKKTFGNNFTDHCLIVYSKADSTLKGTSLEDYVNKQKKHPKMESFLREIGESVAAVNNKTDIPAEEKRNQNTLVNMIDKIVSRNRGEVYTNELFERAQSLHQKVLERCNDQHPALVTAVIELYNSNSAKYRETEELCEKVFDILAKSGTGEKRDNKVILVDGTTEESLTCEECKNQIVSLYGAFDMGVREIISYIATVPLRASYSLSALSYALIFPPFGKHTAGVSKICLAVARDFWDPNVPLLQVVRNGTNLQPMLGIWNQY